MKRKARTFDASEMRMQTYLASRQIASAVIRAKKLTKDPEREARLKQQFCINCHYNRGGLAGQAFTRQPCACCGEDQQYSSTNTDALCKPCAEKHSLCKHCGADINLNVDREEI